MNNKFYSHIGKGLIITLLALCFSISSYQLIDIFDMHIFASRAEQEDFLNEDIYLSATTNKQESNLDSCITIVATDGLNRADIIHLLQQISDFEPKAIGLDLYFELPHPDSSLIINALDSIPNIVCSARYDYNPIDKNYYPIAQSFYDSIAGLSLIKGYTNFPSDNRIHRKFLTYVSTNQRDTLWSMATQLVKIYSPSVFNNIINHNVQEELIAFISKESTPIQFEDITGIDFLSNPQDSKNKIYNKIVLLGDTNNDEDMLSTPIGEMPGVMLHAYATSTILSNNFINKSSPIREWITAILLCLVLVLINDILQNPQIICDNTDKKKEEFIKRIANFAVRFIQFIAIVLLLVLGFRHFIYQHKIVDYAPTILMLGYSMFAYDLYMVVYAIILLFKNKKNDMKKIFVILLSVLLVACSVSFHSDNKQETDYSIHAFNGEIKVKYHNTSVWAIVNSNMIYNGDDELLLSSNDSLTITNASSVALIDRNTYHIFPFSEEGAYDIQTIISIIQERDNNLSQLLSKEYQKGIESRKMTTTTNAASKRSADNDNSILTDIQSIIRNIKNNDITSCAGIELHSHQKNDSIFFELINKNDAPLFVNVIQYDQCLDEVRFCYMLSDEYVNDNNTPLYILLEAQESFILDNIYFSKNGYSYCMIASKELFIPNDIQEMLNFISSQKINSPHNDSINLLYTFPL